MAEIWKINIMVECGFIFADNELERCETKRFRESDLGIGTTLASHMKNIGLSFEDGNVVWVT